jgi:signal transduction histidine kinase
MNMAPEERHGGPRREWGSAPILLAGLTCAAAATVLALTSANAEHRVASAVSNGATIAIFVSVGLFAWRRDPENHFGRLLVVAGFGWFAVSLGSSDASFLYSVGRIAAWIEEVLLVYLFLAYPAGRLETTAARVVVGVAIATVAVLYLPTVLLVGHYPAPSPYDVCGSDCPANAFQISATQPAFIDDVVRPLREVLAFGAFAATAIILIRRVFASTPVVRRTIVPVLLAAALAAGAAAAYLVARIADADGAILDVLERIRAFTTPLAGLGFLVSLVLWQLYEARALERLALSPAEDVPPARLRALLAEALDDESLQLRIKANGGWRDETGAPADDPSTAADRCVVEVENAAIICDPGLGSHRRLVRAAGTWVAMATERERLNRMLNESLHAVEDSRRRLATAAATERRRIERDLHDGAQQRLVTLRVQLGLVEEELRRDPNSGTERLRQLGPSIDAAIDEVRSLARGIYPPLLADAGLAEALRAVALREALPVAVEADHVVRYPLEIESAAYFCCLEALQNAAKHSGAASVTVTISSDRDHLRFTVDDAGSGFAQNGRNGGAGLTNMRDRLAAVGGRIEIESEPGVGTRVSGEVPIGPAT